MIELTWYFFSSSQSDIKRLARANELSSHSHAPSFSLSSDTYAHSDGGLSTSKHSRRPSNAVSFTSTIPDSSHQIDDPNVPVSTELVESPKKGKILGIFPRKKAKVEAPIVRADPTPEEMAPFSTILTPSALYNLIDPKSLEALEKLGGIEGVLEGLGTDRKTGLTDGAGEAEKGGRNIKLTERERVYGANRTPERKGKSLLQLAWMAYQDKVLVSALFTDSV